MLQLRARPLCIVAKTLLEWVPATYAWIYMELEIMIFTGEQTFLRELPSSANAELDYKTQLLSFGVFVAMCRRPVIAWGIAF